MLVLSRQINESIMIGDNIEVTIVDIKGDKVRIGIAAPRNVAVHRREIYLAIQQENMAASRSGGDLAALGDLGSLFGTPAPAPAAPGKPDPDAIGNR